MDLATGLIVLLLAAVFAIVIYFISVSSMKEKTYDEVKAEQKKKAEEYLAQGRSAKEKAKDKKLKKAGKKVKEKTTSESLDVSSDEVDGSKGHVAFIEPPTVVDDELPPMIEEKKKKKNKKKEKPILVNKNEITPVVDTPPPIINHFEQIVPKDDFTLKRSISRENDIDKTASVQTAVQKQTANKQNKAQGSLPKEPKAEKAQPQKPVQQTQKPAQQAPKPVQQLQQAPKPVLADKQVPTAKTAPKLQEKQQIQPQQQKPVEEVVVKTSTKPVQSAASVNSTDNLPQAPVKSSRKKRSEFATLQQMSGEKDAVNVSALMPLVHKAELSRSEIQVLIDVLLNKQQGSSVDSAEWFEGRQDPVVKLKKQLAEKEKALAEEQEAWVALQSKLRELRTELNSERHNTRQLEESLTVARQELSGLGGRVQHSVEEKQALLQQIQQLQTKLSEEHMLLCKMKEEQGQTQGVVQQELLAQRQQLELHIARITEQHQETAAAMEAQIGQMAAQIQEQEAVNSSLNKELSVLRERGAHLQDSAAQTQDLARQIKELHAELERVRSKSQYDTSRLQGEISSLTEQLGLKRAEVEKLNSLTQSLQTENNRLNHQVSSVTKEAQQLRDENETLAAQVTASMERPATEGRENGDLAYSLDETKHLDNSSDKVLEKDLTVEKLKEEILTKDKDISLIKTDLAQKDTLVTTLKADLEKSRVSAEKVLKEMSTYKCLVQEQEATIKALREDKDSAQKMAVSLREDKTEIARLSKDCASRENTIEKLTSELNTHKTKMADQAAIIQALQKEIERYKVGVEAQSGTRDEKERLTSELNKCNAELAEKTALVTSLTQQCDAHLATIKELRSQLESSSQEINKLSQALNEVTDKHSSLSEELQAQKRKNDEAEKSSRKEEQDRTKQLLQRILPHVTVDSKQEYEAWLEQFAEAAQKEKVEGESDGSMLAELEKQNCQLQAMVTHYKAIIADTEGMLNRLQSHVEQEEGRWGQQLQALQAQLEAVSRDRDRLQSGVKNGPSTADDGSDTN